MAKPTSIRELIAKETANEKAQLEMIQNLPAFFGRKYYKWQTEAINSINPDGLFITAANQVGKSTSLIVRNIRLATPMDKSIWKTMWPTSPRPRVFLYLYPSYDVATREFHTKWVPEFLPRGTYKDHPWFGWKAHFEKKDIKQIEFNSGVSIYFLAYAQAATMLQAITAHKVSADEEIPEELYSELRFRLMATGGYFASVFTATLGQAFWRCVMEERGSGELFPRAHKIQVSMFDCQYFEDGTESHWTRERIEAAIAACPTEAEVQRRVYGKFVLTEGRRYPSFNRARNVRAPEGPVPKDWLIYAGVDLGSGTERGHPSAITFVGVRPDFKHGRVFSHWNGRGQLTTAADVFQKFLELRANMRCVLQSYDYSSRDFGTISQRAGESFVQAKKDRELGDNIINSLFRNEMLFIDDIEENYQLIRELENANDRDRKTMALDDSVDSMRYAIVPIGWDWQFLNPSAIPPEEKEAVANTFEEERQANAARHRSGVTPDPELDMNLLPESEIQFWQDYLDS